jgi:RNA polymerase sigma-70 factor, ECF subfamily
VQEQSSQTITQMMESSLTNNAQKLAAFDQHRKLLLSVAYRMLGSVADAEDMVQETFIRW